MVDSSIDFHTRTNRQQAHKPKSHSKHWCNSCDRDMTFAGSKCGTCGVLDSGKRFKKDVV